MTSDTQNELPAIATGELMPEQGTGYFSPVVATLDEKNRPQAEVICTRCTSGLWFTTLAEVKCFCLRMRSLSWQTYKPSPVTQCDGLTDRSHE